jgi:transcriptional regulator with XRE-family HTH domain
LHKRYIKGSKKRLERLERQREKLNIAQQIYDIRTSAGLSQKELAEMIGKTQSVISRVEDADYNRHSLAMLRKIASALNQRIEIRFVPESEKYALA